ncbi:MAG: hypothetical protein M1419_06490 [Bacteroidetes bacterium]|nr:hypothetical protein [Bacteroidota bacterium]
MKLKIFIIVSFLTSILFSSEIFSQSQTQINFLQQRDADENFKKLREAWIEQMHLIEPGVNRKIIDNETRKIKAELRQNNLKSLFKENPKILEDDEIIAGGLLKGKWIERGSNNCAGRIHTADIDFDRNLIYAASAGGNIWRGTIDGTDWQCLNNSFKISNIRMVKIIKKGSINRIIAVGNSSHVYYSENEGITWEESTGLDNFHKWGSIKRAILVSNISNEIYLLGNEWDYDNWKNVSTIYKSNDDGENFQNIYNSEVDVDFCDIWADKYTNGKVYFIHRDTLSSIDINSVIDKIGLIDLQQNFDLLNRIYLKGNCYNNNKHLVLFALDRMSYNYLVFRSTDEGKNWEYRGKLGFQPFEHNSMAVSVTNPNVMFFGGVELYSSFDGGVTWKKRNNWWDYYGSIDDELHADIPGVDVFKDPLAEADFTLVSTDGGLYISADNTISVLNQSLLGLNISQYYSTFTNKNDYTKVYAGSQDQGLQRCLLDSGKLLSFEQIISGDYGHLSSSDDGKTLWSVYPGFAHVYLDFDKTNTKRYSWDFEYNNHLWIPPLIEDPIQPLSAYIAAGGLDNGQYIWHLKCYGQNISAVYLNYNFNSDNSNSTLSALAISPFENKYFYAMTDNGRFFYSDNSGFDWSETEQFKGPDAHYFYGSNIVPSAKSPDKIYIAGSGYSNPGVYISYNNGQSFIPIDSGLPNTMIYEIAVTPDDKYIFAATEVGPYVYIVSQNSWYDMSGLNAPDQTYWSVEYLPDIQTVRFGTYGRGIWDF